MYYSNIINLTTTNVRGRIKGKDACTQIYIEVYHTSTNYLPTKHTILYYNLHIVEIT